MHKYSAQAYGVTVEVMEATPHKVRVHADGAEFYNGPTQQLAYLLSIVEPGNVNPVLLQFMQWYDEEGAIHASL